jgi:hypothetical protein
MKNNFKSIKTMCLIAVTFFIASCDSRSTQHETSNDHDHIHADHEHNYACPMHPEVRGHDGETCPKCGMALERMDSDGNANTFKMEFTSSPQQIEAGKKVILSLTPKNVTNPSAQVPLDVEHEKKIHLILVDDDLSWFNHTHPEYRKEGDYIVEETFPYGGNYILFADYKPTGSTHQLEKINIHVTGNPAPKSRQRDEKLISNVDGYEITFVNGSSLKTGSENHMIIKIEKNGKEISGNDLEKYLGANAHIVMIRLDNKDYIHVHPEADEYPIHAHGYFDKAGTYVMWVQFQTNGNIHTADFVVNVAEGKRTASTSNEHTGHQH